MTADNLFGDETVGVADSPKLSWKKKHGILTWHDDGKRDGYEIEPTWFAGFQCWWPELSNYAFFGTETAHNGDSRVGEGESEDEALANLMTCGHARQRNMRLWHEEQL